MNNARERDALRNIREAIDRPHVKVVSFDVFDTLLVRPALRPTDLFYLVEERIREDKTLPDIPFADLRPWTEREARIWMRQTAPHYDDITLDEIYDIMMARCGLDAETCCRIKQVEIDVELQYLSARKSMKPIYDYALSLGKRIVVASDVYLPASFLIESLRRNGYDRIDRYFVSSELRLSKGSGNLYPHMLRDLDIKPHEMIHIGDNARADVERAKKHRIDAFHFPKISELMTTGRTDWSIWQNRIEHAEPGYRLLHGMVQNEFFDTLPRSGYDSNSLFNGNPYLLGYYGVGPFILALAQWLIRETSARGDEVIGFIARDGWLPKMAYDLLRPYYPGAADSLYFRISRSACYPFDVTNTAQLLFSDKKMHFERTLSVRQVIESRLFMKIDESFAAYLEENGINLNSECRDFQELFRVVGAYGEGVFDGLEAHRKAAAEYYSRIFDGFEKIALFDCGYSGRAQRILAQILPHKPYGYYIFSFDTIHALDKEQLLYGNFLGQPINRNVDAEPIVTAILELLISEHSTGSIIGFASGDAGIEPIIEEEQYDIKTLRTLNAVHAGCLDFVRQAVCVFGSDIRYLHLTPSTASRAIRHFMLAPHTKDAALFSSMTFSNGITGEVRKMIAESEIHSKWKEGYHALRSPAPAKPMPAATIERMNGKIHYKGREIPARINDMRVMPAVDFLDGVALMAAGHPAPELKEKCRDIVRTKSKWLSAAVMLKETGGLWRSRIDLRDKFIAQGYLLLRGSGVK